MFIYIILTFFFSQKKKFKIRVTNNNKKLGSRIEYFTESNPILSNNLFLFLPTFGERTVQKIKQPEQLHVHYLYINISIHLSQNPWIPFKIVI